MKNKTIKIANSLEIAGFLRLNGTACQFVSMLTVTEVAPQMKKRHEDYPKYKLVKKVCRRLGLINVNYNQAVCKRISDKLGVDLSSVEYTNGKSSYVHQMTEDNKPLPLLNKSVNDDGTMYVQYFPHKSYGTKYVLPNGEEVPKATIEAMLYEKKESEYKPRVISLKLSSIAKMRARGVTINTPTTKAAESILVG